MGEVDRLHIENMTKDQANSEMWKRERHCRLTSSNFGRICKMRRSTSHKNVVHSVLYSSFNTKYILMFYDSKYVYINIIF